MGLKGNGPRDEGTKGPRRNTLAFAWSLGPLVAWSLLLLGCTAPMRLSPTTLIQRGDFGLARQRIAREMTRDLEDRQYLLDRMKLASLMLADGRPDAAQIVFEEIYEILRTRGVNEDKTVASVITYEGVKFWKGEPFEQALALAYYSIQQAQMGQWDNARAAAGNSLFTLRDFGKDASTGQRINTAQIAARALAYERGQARGQSTSAPEAADYLDQGYAVVQSNFTLGYMLRGIAAQQLGRSDEARDYLRAAGDLDPRVRPVSNLLVAGDYDTILVVSYGLGPRKIAYGPDNALARFDPRFPSDARNLTAAVSAQETQAFAAVCDVNSMAADHMWNNLEDVRRAKSLLGDALLYGGLIAAGVGAANDSDAAVYAGLGAAAMSLLVKASAHADVRYCDAFPQRLYVVPLRLAGEDSVTLQIEGVPSSRLRLRGLAQPGADAQLRYVRLVSLSGHDPSLPAPSWATSGQIVYANDVTGADIHGGLPYILGGHCVRLPRDMAMAEYHRQGLLDNLTTNDLRELYRAEGISLAVEDADGRYDSHVLEGGRSLVAPMGGTAAFMRLFGQQHPPYRARSSQVRNYQSTLTAKPVAQGDVP